MSWLFDLAATATPIVADGLSFSMNNIFYALIAQSPFGIVTWFLWNDRKALQRELKDLRDRVSKIRDDQLKDALQQQKDQLEASYEQTTALTRLTEAIEKRSSPNG